MAQGSDNERVSIIVTGAATGIGAATARRLADDCALIVGIDVDAERLEAVITALPGEGHRWLAMDLRELAGHDAVVATATAAADRFAGMAHLAAVLRRRDTVDDVTEEDWDLQVDVNLKATFFLNRAVGRALIAQGKGGAIVNFTSQAWNTGGFGGAVVYAATKGGVVSMSRGLARTYAPHAIRVNTVAPGFVETEMMLDGLSDSQVEDFRAMVPLGRMAVAEELASTVSFLLGEDSRYVTGATLNVTGGQLMY
jgi:NAD(P)-dependent dehydrogenase (short-subunit alcohol dehydrogenase family)